MTSSSMQFNKMFIMLPVMMMARKLDGEDAAQVYWVRVTYGVVQFCCLCMVAYTYLQAQATARGGSEQVVYVPPPTLPFADPNAKKKYTETSYGSHVLSNARSLVGSTLFGLLLTIGLHYYKGMIMGLAIQAVMAPLSLAENPLVKALVLGKGIRPEDKIFDEKTYAELKPDDEVVDDSGNPVVRQTSGSNNAATNNSAKGGTAGAAAGGASAKKPLEDVMLDTWDAGSKADISELMGSLTKKNCNTQTSEDHWTPLMILAGLGAPGTPAAMEILMEELGADASITDKEGWTALHWSAFHGSVISANVLKHKTSLLTAKDKEGYTPIDMAKKEGNDEVAKIFEEALGETKKDK